MPDSMGRPFKDYSTLQLDDYDVKSTRVRSTEHVRSLLCQPPVLRRVGGTRTPVSALLHGTDARSSTTTNLWSSDKVKPTGRIVIYQAILVRNTGDPALGAGKTGGNQSAPALVTGDLRCQAVKSRCRRSPPQVPRQMDNPRYDKFGNRRPRPGKPCKILLMRKRPRQTHKLLFGSTRCRRRPCERRRKEFYNMVCTQRSGWLDRLSMCSVAN